MDENPTTSIVDAFAGVVQRCWPEFLAYSAHLEDGSLEICIPSPYRYEGKYLTILADNHLDEVIVGFGSAHSHGGPWNEKASADYQFASFIAFINAILEERVVACEYGTYARIGLMEELRQRPDWRLVRSIRSWRGTHDRG
jgi:hypothetical protein